jgi:ribosomal protein S1
MADKGDTKELALGRVVRARVLKVNSSGLVVAFGRRFSGYIPVDEFAEGMSGSPSQLFRPGDTLTAKIVTICDGGKRLVLSLKDTSKTAPAPNEETLSEAEESAAGSEPLSFERIYRRYQRDSQMRLSLLRKNIESKRGEFR